MNPQHTSSFRSAVHNVLMTKAISTERLILRPWEETDVDFVFDLYSRWVVQRFIGTEPTVMDSRTQAVAKLKSFQALDHPVHGIWAVTRKDDGVQVGTLLLKPIPQSGEEPTEPSGDVEIGWHFHPDHWGNGFASEAAEAVLEHGFASGLERVVAVTNSANTASQSVCRRIGMEHKGTTKKYYNDTCELFVVENTSAAS